MYGWHLQAMSGVWWFVMFVAMAVFGGAFVFGIAALLRHDRGVTASVGTLHQDSAAIGILKERLARGELSEDDFAHRLSLLKEKS